MKRDGVLGNVGRILCVRDQKALRKIASQGEVSRIPSRE